MTHNSRYGHLWSSSSPSPTRSTDPTLQGVQHPGTAFPAVTLNGVPPLKESRSSVTTWAVSTVSTVVAFVGKRVHAWVRAQRPECRATRRAHAFRAAGRAVCLFLVSASGESNSPSIIPGASCEHASGHAAVLSTQYHQIVHFLDEDTRCPSCHEKLDLSVRPGLPV